MFSHRPTVVEIDLNALAFNYKQIREKVDEDIKILAVVKADGYGHGADIVAKELENLGVNLLGVALCEEGIALRKAGIQIPIVLLGSIFQGQVKQTIQYDLTPVIFDTETAQKLASEAERMDKAVKVHIKIDTGMGRIGVLPTGVEQFFSELKKMRNIEIEGVLSHLSSADGETQEDRDFTALQLQRFEECIEEIETIGFSCPLKHIANSAATLGLQPSPCNLVRPGLMLYGAYPSPKFTGKICLKPVMSLKTEIIQIKKVPPGVSISYGRSFVTKRESSIATLPIGYADGYSRLLSNKGEVLIGGKKVPIVGVVCMDMVMVDVTEAPLVCVGDEAVLMGRQGYNEISVHDIAKKTGTISYEIFCAMSKRVPRIYKRDGKIIGKKINAQVI
ncbi:MAG: alanine racemase [Thermodesulfobacteriota bacterium]|nr:alanine racemase [Thermodesulfobacteriota bacterium]